MTLKTSLLCCSAACLLYCIVDFGVATISFSECSWPTFVKELHDLHHDTYDFRTSQFELWMFAILRTFVVILTVILLWALGASRVEPVINAAKLAVIGTAALFASYSPVKVLAMYEYSHDLNRPYFWLGFSFNIFASALWALLWMCVLCKFKGRQTVNVDEDTEQLLEQDQTSNGDLSVAIVNGGPRRKERTLDEKEQDKKEALSKKDSLVLLLRLFGYCKDEWVLYVFGFTFLLCYAGARIFIPYYTGKVIANIVISHSYPELIRSVGLLALLTLVSAVTGGFRGGCFMYAIARVSRKLRSDLFARLVKQEIGFFDTVNTGDITSRLTSDCQTISDTVGLNTNVFLRNFVMFIGSFVVMFKLSWQMTTVTFIAMPSIAVITKVYGSYVDKLSKQTQDKLAKANEIGEEVIGSMRTVRSFANEDAEAYRYKLRLDEVLKVKLKQTFAYVGYVWCTEMFDLGLIVAVLWYGGHLVISKQISGTEMVQILLYQLQLGESLISMGYVFTGLMQSVGASRKVFEYIDRDPKIPNDGTLKPAKLEGRIEFKDVCFAYPSRPDTQVLNNMSFTVSPGETVALVGPSGGGKSSCIALLQHLYSSSNGNVLIDGHPIGLFDYKYLHTKMSLVGQEPVLYARSIQENIAYGMAHSPQMKDLDGVTFARIHKAAEDANAVEFIETQKEKYDTQVGEKGVQLSGGQKQRIAIARALIREPTILLLDEATSALDAESEHLVQEALYKNLSGHTVLLIAHRLSTVEKADRIVVINQGRAVQMGTHQQLLNEDGIYRTLVSRQLLGGAAMDLSVSSLAQKFYSPAPGKENNNENMSASMEISSGANSYRSVHSITSSLASTP